MAVVLITGCSRGIGREAALAFARARDTVYAGLRDLASGSALRARAQAETLDLQCIELDVISPERIRIVIADILAAEGRLDVLINNAGIHRPGAFEDLQDLELRLVMETNFFGPMNLARAVLPTMRAQGDGAIIMVSSLSGIAGLPGDAAYAASKFALEGATEALRHEVDRWGVRVALVEAGLVATGILDASVQGDGLPAAYPDDSPYAALIAQRCREARERLPDAGDPAVVAELLVKISRSDGSQLRWPADDMARAVMKKLFALDDAERDRYLREVSATDWWSAGKDGPGD